MLAAIPPEEAKRGDSQLWGFWLPLILLQLSIAGFWWWSVRVNNGQLVYALDDAYIHMAIAKNVVQHHIWGVTPYGFTSCSSSTLWVILLSAIYFCCGVNVGAPFVLNLMSASLLLLAAWRFLRSHGMQDKWIFVVQVGVIYLTPLPFLIFDGMEHSLHALVTILAVSCASRLLERPKDSAGKFNRVAMIAFMLLLSALRYEGVFLAMAVTLLLLIRRRVWDALATGAAAVAPGLLVGGWATLHGWPLLPTTIVLKTSLVSMATPYGWIRHFYQIARINLHQGQHLVALILPSLSFYIASLNKGRGIWSRLNVASAVFILTALAHLTCAGLDAGYRYEAYLLALGIVVVAAQTMDFMPDLLARPLTRQAVTAVRVAVAMLGGLLFLPLVTHGAIALCRLELATHNIYEQQYQMARFIHKYYEGSSVALNDIGAVNYFAEIRCLDLYGLGSLSVAKAKMGSRFDSTTINQLAREANTRIAIIYQSWFVDFDSGMNQIPPQWVLVGTWTIPHNVIAGDDTVSIFAVDPTEAPRLTKSLKEFSSQLPADVVQGGAYTESSSKI
jgi:hypothetical protein